jgi:chromosome segregation ATPase
MDPLLIVACTTVGTLTGTFVGMFLLRRKLRPPISDSELAELRVKLGTNEVSLAETNANLADARKQVSAQEQTNQRTLETLKEKQQQLDRVSADAEKETAQRLVAEKNARELSAQIATLTDDRDKLDTRLKEEGRLLEEKTAQIASIEPQLQAGKKQVLDLTAHVGRLTAEAAELKGAVEQESRRRVFLEAQLSADQERLKVLISQLAEMQTERQRFEVRLQEERQSARKGIELLLQAQEKLSHMFNTAAEASQANNGNHGSHEHLANGNGQKSGENGTAASDAKREAPKEGEVVTIKVRQAS